MVRSPRLRRFGFVALISAGVLASALLWVPTLIATRTAASAETCANPAPTEDRCRFVGGPLEMQGQPVFVERFPHAFLPLKRQIEFVDAEGRVWTAPERTLTDGATIPALFEPLVGDRQSREYLIAAALHDAYCGVGNEALPTWQEAAWEDVHRMFYEALLVNGTPARKAKILFAAVYLGGPRWDDPARSLAAVPEAVLVQEMIWCIEWIRANDPSIERILTWMSAREAVMKSGDHRPPPGVSGTGG